MIPKWEKGTINWETIPINFFSRKPLGSRNRVEAMSDQPVHSNKHERADLEASLSPLGISTTARQFYHPRETWSTKEQSVQPQYKLQVCWEIKSKTNQVHLSYLTKARIKLAHLVWRAINHVPRVPSQRYISSKPYKYKTNRILVTDYKAIWSMNYKGPAIAYTCLKTFRARGGQGFKRKNLFCSYKPK